MTYGAAKAQCESDGTHLAIPKSKAENDFNASLIPNEDIWIGINDIATEGSFVAVDGRQVSWTKWDKNEPNNLGANEDAVEIRPYRRNDWNDLNASNSKRFVCSLNIEGNIKDKIGI